MRGLISACEPTAAFTCWRPIRIRTWRTPRISPRRHWQPNFRIRLCSSVSCGSGWPTGLNGGLSMFNWQLIVPGAHRALAIGAMAAAFALIGCASQQRNQEQQLKLLVAALPGEYDNNAQVQADARTGVQPAHSPLALTVYKIKNNLIGENVMYVAEHAAAPGHALIFQQVWALAMDKTGKIVQVVYRFRDPQRWHSI